MLWVYLVVTAALIAIVIVVVLLWPRRPAVATEPAIVDYQQYCSADNPCPSGYICEQWCRKAIGQRCNSVYECESAANVCSGTCQFTTAIGTLGNSCPCNDGSLRCTVIDSQGTAKCLRPPGFPCTANSDCSTGICDGVLCANGRDLGEACSTNLECDSGNCSQGVCQLPGITTGAIGAYCDTSVLCSGSAAVCQLNRCTPAQQRLLGQCDSQRLCNAEYQCYYPISGVEQGSCVYPFITNTIAPNTCPLGVCSQGYTCTGGVCVANAQQWATLATQCVTNGITTQHAIWRWRTSDSRWIRHLNLTTPVLELRAISRLQSSVLVDELMYYDGTTIEYADFNNAITTIIPNTINPGNCIGCPPLSDTVLGVTTTYTFTLSGIMGATSVAGTIKVLVVFNAIKTVNGVPTPYQALVCHNGSGMTLINSTDTLPGVVRVAGSPISGITAVDITSNNSNTLVMAVLSGNNMYVATGTITTPTWVLRVLAVPARATRPQLQFFRQGANVPETFMSYVAADGTFHSVIGQHVDTAPTGLTVGAYLPISPQAPAGPYNVISAQSRSVFQSGGVTINDVIIDRAAYLVQHGSTVTGYFFDGVQYYTPGYFNSSQRVAMGNNFMYLYSGTQCSN